MPIVHETDIGDDVIKIRWEDDAGVWRTSEIPRVELQQVADIAGVTLEDFLEKYFRLTH